MPTKYLSAAETAALVRQALREAFPGAKFSVRIKSYSGGASARVCWTDGPSYTQVERITGTFKGSFFDGVEDMRHDVFHTMAGERVNFGLGLITLRREHTDAFVQQGIDALYERLAAAFERSGVERPSLDQYRSGQLSSVQLSGVHIVAFQNVAADLNATLNLRSACGEARPSATLAGIQPHQVDANNEAADA